MRVKEEKEREGSKNCERREERKEREGSEE